MRAIQSGFFSGSTPIRGYGYVMVLIGLSTASALYMAPAACMAETLDAPLNYFLHSFGPAARPTMYLGWVLAGVSAAVCFIIAVPADHGVVP